MISHADAFNLPMAANQPAALGGLGLGSHMSSILPTQSTRASISSINFGVEFELAQLRKQCAILQTENSELKGKVQALQ